MSKTKCKEKDNTKDKDDKFVCDKCDRTANKEKKLCKPKKNKG